MPFWKIHRGRSPSQAFVQSKTSYKAQREIKRGRQIRNEAHTVSGMCICGVKTIPHWETACQQCCPCCKQQKTFYFTCILCLILTLRLRTALWLKDVSVLLPQPATKITHIGTGSNSCLQWAMERARFWYDTIWVIPRQTRLKFGSSIKLSTAEE